MPDDFEKLLVDKMLELDEPDLGSIGPTQSSVQSELGIPKRSETFEERNFRGAPLDVTSGVPGLVRLGVAARDTDEDQMAYLSGIYGPNKARKADTGEWIVRIPGEDGKDKDVLVNERGLSARDMFSMAAYAPDAIGAALAMRAGRMLPGIGKSKGVGGFARDVAAEAIGQETGGAVRDVAARAGVEGQPWNFQEIGERRLGNVPFDMAIGTGLGIIGKTASKLRTPLGPATDFVDVEGQQAARNLQDKYGVETPMSLGEKTGSPIFKRIEGTAGKLPGSSKYFSELTEAKTAAFRKIVNRIMGLPDTATPGTAIPNAEDIGQEAIEHIRTKLTPMQQAVESSRNQVLSQANQNVLDELSTATTPQRQMYPEKVGANIRQKVFDMREAFRAENRKNYGAIPGADVRAHVVPDLALESYAILDSLPTQKGGTEPSKLVPDNVVGFLRELASNPNEKRSLVDLQTMKGEIDNAIAEGQAIPNRQTKFLTQIKSELNKAIDTVVSSNPAMKAAYENANKSYSANVGKFKDRYIARLFKEIDEGGGFVNDEDIVRKIGPTEFQSFKNVLGATSKEFTELKRAIVDEIYNDSLMPGEQLVKGDALIKNLSDFYRKNRSVAEEILGTKVTELQRLGEILTSADAKIDADKLMKSLRSGEPLSRSVEKLVKEQAALDKAYRSQIVKDIGERRIGESFDAGEFINRFYDQASKPELESVMAQLADNPEVIEKLRRKAIEKLLFTAQRSAKAADPASLGRGDPFLPPNSQTLKTALGNPDKRERLQIILGKDTYDAITDLGKVVRSSEVNDQAFQSAGGIAAGMQLSNLLHGGVLGYASNYVKQKAAAIILSNNTLRKWAANGVMQTPFEVGGVRLADTRQGALITAMIGSTPFLEAVVDEFGEGTAASQFVSALKRSVNIFESQKAKNAKEPTEEELLDKRIFEIP